MKIYKVLLTGLTLLLFSVLSYSQDKRTLETKVADLLAQFPAGDLQSNDKLMGDMLGLGEAGIRHICDRIIPPGTGDDTAPRFAVESLSRYLSQKGREDERAMWEKICISYATNRKDPGVIDFFIKQLQIIGGSKTAEALKKYITDKDNCTAAISAITAIGNETAELIFTESLKDRELPCAAAVMNALASMKSGAAVNEYIYWASDLNVNTRASAYNALAQSGSPLAYPVLLKAAQGHLYRWEQTGATAALLNYARNVALNGDISTMDKICKLLISKCNDRLTIQNKTAALGTYVSFHGINAMPDILKAAAYPDSRYRNAAITLSLSIEGNEVTRKWLTYYPKATSAAKPAIINMLGIRGDKQALPLITSSLKSQDVEVRRAAAQAIARLEGKNAAPALVDYMNKSGTPADQEAAKSALKSIAGYEEIDLLRPVLKEGSPVAIRSAVELMAWKKEHKYFADIIPLASSDDEGIRSAAFKALSGLAGQDDQQELIRLLSVTDEPEYIADIQTALAEAAGKSGNAENRSSVILKAMDTMTGKEKLIPVLAKTGGRDALAVVLKEFVNGNPQIREVCFKALTSWTDYSASSALYEICSSKNKTYEAPAFEGYVRQVRTANLPDEQKLLLFRKIMPFAVTPERKNEILTELGKLKTYQSLFFTGNYLDDPQTAATAAKSAMYIALPSVTTKTGMYGNIVREILTRAIPKLSGPESEYDREMINKYIATLPADEGFKPMFNGKDLTGWQGLVENPLTRAKMTKAELAKKQAEANLRIPANWSVKDGCIWFNGKGDNLCSVDEYGDFEMLVDWKISKAGDSGIYLRGSPQVQIWDTSRKEAGAQVGSGGLYNNQKNPSKPLMVADNPVGDWNTFRIIMIGDKVTVWLNGELVVDNVVMENYWDRRIPIFPKGPIELQAHGTDLAFRDIYVREIREKENK